MTNPPAGEVTFLFTDVEGSTRLWELHADQMRPALAEHDRRLRAAMEQHLGYVFTTAGDSFAVAFASATEALAAAVQAQQSLSEPCGEIDIRVRIGLHTGTAAVRDGDYFGAVVNRCARLMAAGHGGQILLSATTADLVRDELADGTRLIDRGERRLKDLLQPERIYELRQPGLLAGFPELRTLEGGWSNLPIQLTSFVGRDQELADVRRMLDANALVTLTGSGGAGKTRLALQLAADSLEAFPDGVRLVELAALSDPDLVVDEVAEAFGAQLTPDMLPLASVAAKIGWQRMLLVLDNCEHLVVPAAELAGRLLAECPSLKILATSREPLGVKGEAPYRVPSLGVPQGSEMQSVRNSGSVMLFTERATVANPNFAVTADNVDAVVAICQRLDGIPLAIELAAARLRVLSPSQIAARLDERFRVLGVAGKQVVGRHQTLRAAIDWSHELLSPDERTLLRRLSVFSGTFTLEAAEAVCSAEPLDSLGVLDLISTLVDKSMLVTEDATEGDSRFRLLQSMRDYAAAKLGESDDAATLYLSHAEFFATVAAGLQVKQRAGEIGEALAMLDQDEDNVRAALRYSIDSSEFEIAARIIGAVGYLWYAIGSFREGVDWSQQLFAENPQLPDELLAPALHTYATLLGSWSEPNAGIEMLEREVAIRSRLGDPARLAGALNNLGNLLNDVGRRGEAETALRAAIEQFQVAGESTAMALASLGAGYLQGGDYQQADERFSDALREAEASGDAYAIAVITLGLGQCAGHQGKLDEARTLLDDGRARFAALGVAPGVIDADFSLALVDRAADRRVAAAGRLLSSLETPDAHWYLAAKVWMIQVAASIISDRSLAARLVGVADAYYRQHDEVQPAFVLADLVATRQRLSAELGAEAFAAAVTAGKSLSPAAAADAAKGALSTLVDA